MDNSQLWNLDWLCIDYNVGHKNLKNETNLSSLGPRLVVAPEKGHF